MKGFDTLKVKSAVKSRNKFDLSRTHLTTMDFGEIVPLMVEETVPGDQISVDATYFSRLAPLVKPTYGKFSFKTVSAYVPYHQVAEDVDAWMAGLGTWEGVTTYQRYITYYELFQFILTNCTSGYVIGTSIPADASNADVIYKNTTGTEAYLCFTEIGKYYVKVLNALGYAIPENVNLKTGSTWMTSLSTIKLSAYPLLAFFKVYNDYMSQSQRFNTSQLSNFLRSVRQQISTSGYSNGAISAAGLSLMFGNLKLNYDNDYFVSAWQSPNAAISGNQSISSMQSPYSASGSDVLTNDDANVRVISAGSAGFSSNLSQRTLDFLKSFDDWVRRNNYSGSRAVQQVYSRFGIKSDDYKTHYAHVLATDSQPVQVGDVTATADTTNVPLGDYAGKGIMSSNSSVSFKADDYGCFIILGYYTVVPMNAYGFDRRVLRNTPLDYYNPEFDGLGAEAISVGEFYTTPIADTSQDLSKDTDVYGFTERYNSYRYGRDVITGDFRNYRINGDDNVWHTGRNLTTLRISNNLVAQSSSVNTFAQSDSEYDRIFATNAPGVNHFYLTCQFKVNAIRPMLNLNQVVRLGEGDTVVPRNGNVIS